MTIHAARAVAAIGAAGDRWWVWVILEKVRHSSFHRVVAVEGLPDDDGPITLVEATCGLVWPLEQLAAAVPWHIPVLDLGRDGAHARCQNCADGDDGRKRRSFWSRRLAEHRSGRR